MAPVKAIRTSGILDESLATTNGNGYLYRKDLPPGCFEWITRGDKIYALAHTCACGCGLATTLEIGGYGWNWWVGHGINLEAPTLIPYVHHNDVCPSRWHLDLGQWRDALL